ncbi:MAG: DUF2330 domain-containing protein [Pseudomonadota bacterium]
MPSRNSVLGSGAAVLLISALANPHPAQACPCVTLVGSHAEEVAQRALVVVNDDSLDYILQLAVEGDASELGWLVPTPALPDDPVLVEDTFLSSLDDATAPFLHACSGGGGCDAQTLRADKGNSAVTVWSEGRIENLEFAVVSSSSSSELATWLADRGYQLDAAAQARVDDYASRAWFFVALRVSGTALQGDRPSLGPLRIHIPTAGTPIFPLGMTALSTNARVSLLLFIAADNRMAPANYPLVTIDGSALRADEEGGSNYDALVRRAIDAEGKGFLVEFAGDAPSYAASDPALQVLLEGKQMVRLYTDVEPAALNQDLLLEERTSVETPYYPCLPSEGTDDTGCASAGQIGMSALPLLTVLGLLVRLRRHRGAR